MIQHKAVRWEKNMKLPTIPQYLDQLNPMVFEDSVLSVYTLEPDRVKPKSQICHLIFG